MRIVAISDTHTLHTKINIPEGDILVHAGDFTNVGELEDAFRFNRFLGTLPHRYKIVIAGNHDFCFQRDPKRARALMTNCIYLEDSSCTVEGIQFYGSPWQPYFFDWAFNLRRGKEIKRKWDLIPDNTDILITHGPPLGHGDMTRQNGPVGCQDLLEKVLLVKPKYHIFGHIHEAAGQSSCGGTQFINASCCNFEYKPIHPPIVFDYEESRSR